MRERDEIQNMGQSKKEPIMSVRVMSLIKVETHTHTYQKGEARLIYKIRTFYCYVKLIWTHSDAAYKQVSNWRKGYGVPEDVIPYVSERARAFSYT